jgi:hypothetical protein
MYILDLHISYAREYVSVSTEMLHFDSTVIVVVHSSLAVIPSS